MQKVYYILKFVCDVFTLISVYQFLVSLYIEVINDIFVCYLACFPSLIFIIVISLYSKNLSKAPVFLFAAFYGIPANIAYICRTFLYTSGNGEGN